MGKKVKSRVVDLCEWDPGREQGATVLYFDSEVFRFGGCPNAATLIVGANGQLRLCDSCATLPRFKRFKVRRPIHGSKEQK